MDIPMHEHVRSDIPKDAYLSRRHRRMSGIAPCAATGRQGVYANTNTPFEHRPLSASVRGHSPASRSCQVSLKGLLRHCFGEHIDRAVPTTNFYKLGLSTLKRVLYPEVGRFYVPVIAQAGTMTKSNGGLRVDESASAKLLGGIQARRLYPIPSLNALSLQCINDLRGRQRDACFGCSWINLSVG